MAQEESYAMPYKTWDEAARAALAAIEAAGYRVVPVEPTEEMVDRIGAELVRPNVYMGGTPPGAKLRARSNYAAMLAARPKVQT